MMSNLKKQVSNGLEACKNQRSIRKLRREMQGFLEGVPTISDSYAKAACEYWAKYHAIVPDWHRFYTAHNGVEDVRYVPEDMFHCYIEPRFNRMQFARAYSDKSAHSLIFPDINRPEVLFKCVNGRLVDDRFETLSRAEAIARCRGQEIVVLKPAIESGGGRSIRFVEAAPDADFEGDMSRAMDALRDNYVVQKRIQQHPDIARFHPESVNTIRIMTLMMDGQPHALNAILRMGQNQARLDNKHSGGISVGIRPDGTLCEIAFDVEGKPYECAQNGQTFAGSHIPSFDRIVEMVTFMHRRLSHFRIVSWDVCVDSEGQPMMIEYNLIWQGVNGLQINNGCPLFGEWTDRVLEEAFSKRG